jgi:hypothetical protein
MSFQDTLKGIAQTAAGTIPGGRDAFDALSTREGRNATMARLKELTHAGLTGAKQGAQAGIGATQAQQQSQFTFSTITGQTGLYIGLGVAAVVGLVLLTRKR